MVSPAPVLRPVPAQLSLSASASSTLRHHHPGLSPSKPASSPGVHPAQDQGSETQKPGTERGRSSLVFSRRQLKQIFLALIFTSYCLLTTAMNIIDAVSIWLTVSASSAHSLLCICLQAACSSHGAAILASSSASPRQHIFYNMKTKENILILIIHISHSI